MPDLSHKQKMENTIDKTADRCKQNRKIGHYKKTAQKKEKRHSNRQNVMISMG